MPRASDKPTTTRTEEHKHDESACWINGSLVPAHKARVSVFDHGLLYGDGVFEGIRFYRGKAFRLEAHLARLERSAAAIRLVLPGDRDALAKAATATIAAYGQSNGYLRLIVTRGESRCPAININGFIDILDSDGQDTQVSRGPWMARSGRLSPK